MLQQFIRLPEFAELTVFLIHLEKTPLSHTIIMPSHEVHQLQ